MYGPRETRIDRYTGPYERWVFSQELGRSFAFPAIRDGELRYMTALMERGGTLSNCELSDLRIPPLWAGLPKPEVVPFAFRVDTAPDDVGLSRAMSRLGGPRVRMNFPVDPAAWTAEYDAGAASQGWTHDRPVPSVVIGVIDDGLPFAHRAFLNGQGQTRVSNVWLQAARAEPSAAVPFGRELTNGQIDALRTAHLPHERAIYRAAGAVDAGLPELGGALRHHGTHGGHMAGIAAGNDPFVGASPLPDGAWIVGVQLPNTVAWDTSGFGKEAYMLAALHYIFDRADRIAEGFGVGMLPLVVNFSYGWSANGHDGQTGIERAMEDLLTARRARQSQTAIVMSTGNNFAQDMHAAIPPERLGGPFRVGWQILPDDRTSSYLEIWWPEGFDAKGWRVEIAPPEGHGLDRPALLSVTADPALAGGDPRRFDEIEQGGQNIGQISADRHLGRRWRVMLALIPTVTVSGDPRRAPAGRWTVTLWPGSNVPQDPVEIWVQRDDDPVALHTFGRQSRLVDMAAEGATPSVVTGFGCYNGIGSAPSVTRVAGHCGTSGSPAAYSGAGRLGFTSDGVVTRGVVPTLSAVSDQGPARPGLPSIGVLSGSGARLQGTSAAAASVTRLMAASVASGGALFDAMTPIPQSETDARRTARQGSALAPAVCGRRFEG
ncbi:MAG: S8 family serine peptidase [Rhodobacterales bacterium]